MFDMLPAFNDVIQTFDDPQRLHALMVHVPIAVAMLGLILTLGVTLTGSKASGLRWTTIFIFLIGTLAALWASHTGEEAEAHLPVKPSTIGQEVLDKHKGLAEFFWISLAVPGFLILLSTVRVTWFRSVTLVFALLTSALSVAWVAAIGHYGGELVYKHSVGVPSAGVHSDPEPKSTENKDKVEVKDKAIETPAGETKDKLPTPPAEKDKTAPVKDKAPEKDKALENNGERVLPPIDDSKKSSIFR